MGIFFLRCAEERIVLLLHRGCGFKAAESGIWIQVRPKKCKKNIVEYQNKCAFLSFIRQNKCDYLYGKIVIQRVAEM